MTSVGGRIVTQPPYPWIVLWRALEGAVKETMLFMWILTHRSLYRVMLAQISSQTRNRLSRNRERV